MMYGDFAAYDDLGDPSVLDPQTAVLEPQRVAERDELMGALRRLHAGDDGGVEHRTLAGAMTARTQRARHLTRQAHARLGDGAPLRHLLGADIHHGRLATRIEVREAAPCHQPPM